MARRSEPMLVKYWSRAGLILSYWCNARCASCYLSCGPEHPQWMDAEEALSLWRQLRDASPHGCRIHLTGGEPFGNWPRLLEIARRAQREGLGPLEKVETNAFWATEPAEVRRRLAALDEAGMEKLSISADPYHQQYVPMERPRLLARQAEEVLGAGRVRVRWADWLAEGVDTAGMPAGKRATLMVRYAGRGRDRLGGRAAELLAPELPLESWERFADTNCREALLRGRHVHIDPDGNVIPGTCAGVVLGRLQAQTVGELWSRLHEEGERRAVLGTLIRSGPAGLAERARPEGFEPADGYASKCHLCWHVRRFLARRGRGGTELGPDWMMRAHPETADPPGTYQGNTAKY